jgi:hypothetical protein
VNKAQWKLNTMGIKNNVNQIQWESRTMFKIKYNANQAQSEQSTSGIKYNGASGTVGMVIKYNGNQEQCLRKKKRTMFNQVLHV